MLRTELNLPGDNGGTPVIGRRTSIYSGPWPVHPSRLGDCHPVQIPDQPRQQADKLSRFRIAKARQGLAVEGGMRAGRGAGHRKLNGLSRKMWDLAA